jgi:hypothetical protein
MGISPLGPVEAPWTTWGGVRSPGTLIVKRGLSGRHLSVWVLCEGSLEGGGSLTEDTEGCVEGSVDGHLSTGNWKAVCLPGTSGDG